MRIIDRYGIGGKKAEILKVVDKYGVLTRKQILEYVDISYKNLLCGLNWLEEHECIRQYKGTREYLAFITKLGSELVGTNNFPYPTDKQDKTKPSFGRLRHAIMVNDAIIQMVHELEKDTRFSEIEVESERDLRAEWYLNQDFSQKKNQKKKSHTHYFPDFVITAQKNQESYRLAGEVELSRKPTRKLIDKLRVYKKAMQAKNHLVDRMLLNYYDAIVYYYDLESVRKHVLLNARRVGIEDRIFFRKMEERKWNM